MTKEEIFQCGFISNFISEYYKEKIYSYYPDKERLLYIICDNEEERQNVTKEQINIVKAKISELGFEELSFSYLLSCKPESLDNFIEPENRFDFWLKRFAEEFESNFKSFKPITDEICRLNNISELNIEAVENEDEFWEYYPNSLKPQIQDFLSIIPSEANILSLVQYDIEQFKENEDWEFDFEDYHKYIEVNKPLEILFNLSELLVQLTRLEMFKSFLQQDLPEKPENKLNITATLQTTKFTVFETIMKELNFIAWVFESQISEQSKDISHLPIIHDKGRFLPNVIDIQSNIQMLKIQEYFQHYTERFEKVNDKTVLSNELIEIYKRAKQIISFYDENLHSNSDCVKTYFENLPDDFKSKINYNKKHTALIVVNDLQIVDIYFGLGNLLFGFNAETYYDVKKYKIRYITNNSELLRFCQKLIDFVGRFQVNLSDVLEPEKLEYLRRLCEISLDYSKEENWSVGSLPLEFDAITKVDLFVENFIKSIEILAKEGKDVNILIDLFIQTVKTNLENPLLEKNANINKHLFNKLEGVKLLLNAKALPYQEKKQAQPKNVLSFQKQIPFYSLFTEILNKMCNDNFDFKLNIDYTEITINVINEIKEKLFELQNNEQRMGFLKNVFRGFFDDGKDYHLYQISKLEYLFKDLSNDNKKYSDDEFNFIYDCLLCLRSIVEEISEQAIIYDLDFNEIMLWAWRHTEKGVQNPYEVFVYFVKSNENENPKESTTKAIQNLPKYNEVKTTITINPEAKESIFSILKDFFEVEQQNEFEKVLTTFGTVKSKLIFKSNSNQFTDTFKKLFENNFILGCQKTDLINWIVLNFNFMYRNEVKEFKTKTVEQIISGNQTFCKKPIIEIKNGQILKIDY